MCWSKSSTKKCGKRKDGVGIGVQEEESPKFPSSNLSTNKRRAKRTRLFPTTSDDEVSSPTQVYKVIRKQKSKFQQRHENDRLSGGIDALLPSLVAVGVALCIIASRSGFRGRSTVAGVDLGTTNSVICVQQQAATKGVGKIECIPDSFNNSPIIPSCVSFQRNQQNGGIQKQRYQEKLEQEDEIDKFFELPNLPRPSDVIVGANAKTRIDTHPLTTFYHAKRVLGRKLNEDSVQKLKREVEFEIVAWEEDEGIDDVSFRITSPSLKFKPQNVGTYIIHHLFKITRDYLQHDNVRSAVIAIPAKFNINQRKATVEAFTSAGIQVARILEEPVAAALAYGLQKKEGVDYIMVYDFGGGTLDVSLLSVSDGGYVEVMGSEGDDELGGADFDSAVAHYLLKDEKNSHIVEQIYFALNSLSKNDQSNDHFSSEGDIEEEVSFECSDQLKIAPLCSVSSFHTIAEKMKIDLSLYTNGRGVVKRKCLGLPNDYLPYSVSDMCTKLEIVELKLTSEQYDEACQALYDKSMFPIQNILSGLNMHANEIDEVVMVGGTTRMPQIRRLVQKETGVDRLNTSIDPDLTVAYGAASVID